MTIKIILLYLLIYLLDFNIHACIPSGHNNKLTINHKIIIIELYQRLLSHHDLSTLLLLAFRLSAHCQL